MNSRDRFLNACQRIALDRPPLWVMRQAGRYLPEYRALKEKYNFLKMVQTPELAMEVTLQPMRRFSLDAAILFSDILVIPEAMGQPYSFRDQGGIEMNYALNSHSQIASLRTDRVEEKLQYVFDAIQLTKAELNFKQALIGFGGSPWTLATYMVEGGSSKSYVRIKSMLLSDPKLFHLLLEKITDTLISYFKFQVRAGVDAIQIFDSWGGILSEQSFWEGSGMYLQKIVSALKGKVPIIVFSKGSHAWIKDLKRIGAHVLGLDWTISISRFYDCFNGKVGIQGNLDPAVMSTTPEIVRRETLKILRDMKSRPGHIFNLGHGILPNAKIECMEALVETVKTYPKELT